MLYKYYNAVKTLVGTVASLEKLEWFNNQYTGIIPQDHVAFVEFPEPLLPEPVSKSMERAELRIRIHVVSRVLQRIDSAIPDAEIQAHETICEAVSDKLRAEVLTYSSAAITSKLRWCGWQHFHKYEGWMVTWIDFVCKTIAL